MENVIPMSKVIEYNENKNENKEENKMKNEKLEERLLRRKIPNILIKNELQCKYLLSVFMYIYMNCNREGKLITTIEEIGLGISCSSIDKRVINLEECRRALTLLMKDTEEYSQFIHISLESTQRTIDIYNERKKEKGKPKVNNEQEEEQICKNFIKSWNITNFDTIYPNVSEEDILDKKKIKDGDTIEIYLMFEDSDIQQNYTSVTYNEYNYLTMFIRWYKIYAGVSLDTPMLLNIYFFIKMICTIKNNISNKISTENNKNVEIKSTIAFNTLAKYGNCSARGALNYCKILERIGLIKMEKGNFFQDRTPTTFYLSEEWKYNQN